ncbi:MAG: hypothetical protein A2W31_11490 [Planctomycetes bacterium RBG_16_64_10]|nr:MAG: hypothetical protein A2W31_11490 [Planctomycetes bacterium RBG_16_64_10]
MTANDIEQAVRRMDCWQAMIWLPQMRVGTGHGGDGERTMDLWGIEPSGRNRRVSIEIKVSRGDFFRDVSNRMKQRRSRMLSNEFYYAGPEGLLTADDVPQWAGLIEVGTEADGRLYGRHVIPAPWFDSSAPTWRFVASLARRVAKMEIPNVTEGEPHAGKN